MPSLVYIADDEPNIRKLASLALRDSGSPRCAAGFRTRLCWIG